MPLNKVDVGAPSVAGVPVCFSVPLNEQKFDDATLELLDDELVLLEELVELLLDELIELEMLEELTELVLLEELEAIDEELLLFEALLEEALAAAVVGSAEPPPHAEIIKQKLLNKLTRLKRAREFMIRFPKCFSIWIIKVRLKIRCVTVSNSKCLDSMSLGLYEYSEYRPALNFLRGHIIGRERRQP